MSKKAGTHKVVAKDGAHLPTPKEALDILYDAVRNLNATAEAHDNLKACATIVFEGLNKGEEEKKESKKKEKRKEKKIKETNGQVAP